MDTSCCFLRFQRGMEEFGCIFVSLLDLPVRNNYSIFQFCTESLLKLCRNVCKLLSQCCPSSVYTFLNLSLFVTTLSKLCWNLVQFLSENDAFLLTASSTLIQIMEFAHLGTLIFLFPSNSEEICFPSASMRFLYQCFLNQWYGCTFGCGPELFGLWIWLVAFTCTPVDDH